MSNEVYRFRNSGLSLGAGVLEGIRLATGEEWTVPAEGSVAKEGSVELLQRVIAEARQTIRVVTEHPQEDLFTDDETRQLLEEQLRRGVEVGIIHPGQIDLSTLAADSALRTSLGGTLRLSSIQERRLLLQFAVVDGQHTLHTQPNSDVGITQGHTMVRWGDRRWASEWEQRFDAVRDMVARR